MPPVPPTPEMAEEKEDEVALHGVTVEAMNEGDLTQSEKELVQSKRAGAISKTKSGRFAEKTKSGTFAKPPKHHVSCCGRMARIGLCRIIALHHHHSSTLHQMRERVRCVCS